MLICKHVYINSCPPRPTNGLERQELLLLLNEGKLAEKKEFETKKVCQSWLPAGSSLVKWSRKLF